MCHRCNESTNQWINESVIQGINESINKRVTESVNQEWTKEWLNWRKEGGMDEWMDEWVAFLCGLLLHWATSFFSYFFSEQPLVWATSSFTCLPASSSVASATHFFSSCSCYNAFSNQLQSRLAGASQHHWCFPARSRVNALCHSRLQTMGTRRHKSGAAPNVQFFSILIRAHSLSLSLHSGDLIYWKCPTSVSFLRFLCEIKLSLRSCVLISRPAPVETEALLRRPRKPQKTTGFCARQCFSPVNSSVPDLLHFQTTWWWVVDMMIWLTWLWEF